MKLRALLTSGCLSIAMAVSAAPAVAATAHGCTAGMPAAAANMPASQREANTIFRDLQINATEAFDHADKLQSFDYRNLGWETQAEQLNGLRYEINQIGDKVCRLESIRGAAAPWQQSAIDGISETASQMANNTQSAILFANAHKTGLWDQQYRNDLDNLLSEAKSLTQSVDNAVEFPGVSKEYQDLRHGLGQ